jgi:hypothetical protein
MEPVYSSKLDYNYLTLGHDHQQSVKMDSGCFEFLQDRNGGRILNARDH